MTDLSDWEDPEWSHDYSARGLAFIEKLDLLLWAGGRAL